MRPQIAAVLLPWLLVLWRAGKAAEPALREAIQSDAAEVAARAARILRHFRYGRRDHRSRLYVTAR